MPSLTEVRGIGGVQRLNRNPPAAIVFAALLLFGVAWKLILWEVPVHIDDPRLHGFEHHVSTSSSRRSHTLLPHYTVTRTHPVNPRTNVGGCPNTRARVLGNNCDQQYDGRLHSRGGLDGPWVGMLPRVNPGGSHAATLVELKVQSPPLPSTESC